ncbi:hypothetical protein, partial [Rhodococcus marinonascens]|uniref:hypothetical protein n=1 Tax=Rhodococcus marinonascens TaxID=38311 RepID=UPI001114FE1C
MRPGVAVDDQVRVGRLPSSTLPRGQLIAWSKAPTKAEGVVYRGLPFDGITVQEVLTRYAAGDIEDWVFAATSPSLVEAIEYARRLGPRPL